MIFLLKSPALLAYLTTNVRIRNVSLFQKIATECNVNIDFMSWLQGKGKSLLFCVKNKMTLQYY